MLNQPSAIIVDYSLYLVTGRHLLPPGKNFLESLEEAIQGGITIVQIREKDADTKEFLEIALRSQEICQRYSIPLLINDRIDIALAINAHGVHLGQSDMPVAVARRLLPRGSIIGVSCHTVAEAKKAVEEGADYVGIGPVWNTQTKALVNSVVGVRGVGVILEALDGTGLKAVAIGGIDSTNLLRTLHGTVSSTQHALDGVAVVSSIVASQHSHSLAAQTLLRIIQEFRNSSSFPLGLGYKNESSGSANYTQDGIFDGITQLMSKVKTLNPLIHQITNNVVATQSANATLALGATPIMATAPQEAEDLAAICSALLVNIGTLTQEGKDGMLLSGQYVNRRRKPVVFDPVGVGASAFRKEVTKKLLDTWQASVIKGNPGELAALSGSTEVSSKGVDSVGPGFKNPTAFVKLLARKERCIILMTGPTDYISDGHTVVCLRNGNELLGNITGSGCLVGTCVATFCGVSSSLSQAEGSGRLVEGDMLLGAICGVLALTVAAELAVIRGVNGSGSFLPGLIDALGSLTPDIVRERANVEIII